VHVPPLSVAPKKQHYLRTAGGAAFSFSLFGFLLAFWAAFLTLSRRRARLDMIPGQLPGFFKSKIACVMVHALISFFAFLAFVVYAGIVNGHIHKDTTIHKVYKHAYGGAFGFAILVWLTSFAVGGLVAAFDDADEAAKNAANNAASSGGNVVEPFASPVPAAAAGPTAPAAPAAVSLRPPEQPDL
jgi:hypothetical protein